jgi:hypothetical protein
MFWRGSSGRSANSAGEDGKWSRSFNISRYLFILSSYTIPKSFYIRYVNPSPTDSCQPGFRDLEAATCQHCCSSRMPSHGLPSSPSTPRCHPESSKDGQLRLVTNRAEWRERRPSLHSTNSCEIDCFLHNLAPSISVILHPHLIRQSSTSRVPLVPCRCCVTHWHQSEWTIIYTHRLLNCRIIALRYLDAAALGIYRRLPNNGLQEALTIDGPPKP